MVRFPSIWENVADADWLHLTDEESVRWTGRPSRFTIAPTVLGGLFVAISGLALWYWSGPTVDLSAVPAWVRDLPLLLTIGGLALAGWVYLDWLRLLYVITDEEVYVKRGFLSRDVVQVRLDRVQNTAFDQSVGERLLGYGDIDIYTAGTDTQDLTLENVPNPEQVSRLLTELLSEQSEEQDGRRSQPV